jgi:catechol 2,3-dioxygenase-like lactoylglutathione lyase family enzyme
VVKLDHLMIPVSDWKASLDWYVTHLGFSVEFEAPDGGPAGAGVGALQDDAGLTVFLEQVKPPILSGQANYALQIDSVDGAYERLTAAGARFVAPPGQQFWGYGAVLADPDGHLLNLWDETSMNGGG